MVGSLGREKGGGTMTVYEALSFSIAFATLIVLVITLNKMK